MELTYSQQDRILGYLFGEQNESEREKFELDFFSDPDLLTETNAICDDLIVDYWAGKLPADQHDRFTQRLHAVPFLRERAKLCRALFCYARTVSPIIEDTPQKLKQIGFWQQLRAQLNPENLFSYAFVMLAFSGILLIGCWYLRGIVVSDDGRRNSAGVRANSSVTIDQNTASVMPSQTHPIVAPRPAQSTPAARHHSSSMIASILLSAEITRGASEISKLKIPPRTGAVRLQLEISEPVTPSTAAVLQSSMGPKIKNWNRVTAARRNESLIIDLDISSDLLKKGEYLITLQDKDKKIFQSHFQVE